MKYIEVIQSCWKLTNKGIIVDNRRNYILCRVKWIIMDKKLDLAVEEIKNFNRRSQKLENRVFQFSVWRTKGKEDFNIKRERTIFFCFILFCGLSKMRRCFQFFFLFVQWEWKGVYSFWLLFRYVEMKKCGNDNE